MGVVSRRWMWVESVGVVVRRYNITSYYLSLLLLYLHVLFCSSIPTFCSFLKCFIYTDSEIIVSNRWDLLRLAPITREMQSINGVSLRVLGSLMERIAFKTFES